MNGGVQNSAAEPRLCETKDATVSKVTPRNQLQSDVAQFIVQGAYIGEQDGQEGQPASVCF